MRIGWSRSLLLGGALALGVGADGALAAKPPLCTGGVFQVEAAASPLVPAGAVPDLLTVGDDGATSIESGCPEVTGKLAAAKQGTKLRAKWTKKSALCTGLPKPASLKATFDPGCDTLTGSFRSKGLKRVFTATRAGIALAGDVPSAIHGEPLHVGHATGGEMLATDPGWGDTFSALGASADSVEVATSAPLPDSHLDFRMATWTAPGAGWAQRLADVAAAMAAHPDAGYAAEPRTLAGRSVSRVSVPAVSDYEPTYYYVSGDTLFLIASRDEGLVGEVLAALPPEGAAALRAVLPRADPPALGTVPPMLRLLRPVAQPVCVAEPFNGRVIVEMMALDGYYQIPVPATFVVEGIVLGATHVPSAAGMLGSFYYKANLFGHTEQVQFLAGTAAGAYGVTLVNFPVQHCLDGTWQDADRVLQVDRVLDGITAHIQSGTLCGEEGGIAFTGSLSPGNDHFSGSDLKVCNFDECVQAGLQENSTVTDYSAAVSLDGNSVEFSWESGQMDLVYDDNHKLIACNPNGDIEPRSFSIDRLSFGPYVP